VVVLAVEVVCSLVLVLTVWFEDVEIELLVLVFERAIKMFRSVCYSKWKLMVLNWWVLESVKGGLTKWVLWETGI
jgi:hypothetical protein